MIIGGSQGSMALNEAVEKNFNALLDLADIIHLTGEGKSISKQHARYFARTTVLAELPHLYGFSDLVVTRAGAGVLSELAALKKAAIVVPLPGVAHDHQVKNAEFLAARQAVEFLSQDRLGDLPFVVSALLGDVTKRKALGEALSNALPGDAAAKVANAILDVLTQKS
jgi:UDP-N-acetylglucosamine--N-acetylmuramyl-(pentapeptide) pyrophosphoryl-undecaprenol N-acetylglucosamine transferase